MQRIFIHLLLLCGILSFGFRVSAQEGSFASPDFDYPETVIENAQKVLADAANNGNGAMRLQAILEISKAKLMIDYSAQTVQEILDLIETQLAKKGLSESDKALLLTYETSILEKLETCNRSIPSTEGLMLPLPKDISTWNIKQITYRIQQIFEEAIAMPAPSPIQSYENVLEYTDELPQYLPTAADFIKVRFINYLQGNQEIRSWRALSDSIISAELAMQPEPSAPFFYWICKKNNLERSYTKKSEDKTIERSIELYKKYSSTEAARYLLLNILESWNFKSYIGSIIEHSYGTDERYKVSENSYARTQEFIDITAGSLSKFPAWWGNERLQYILEKLKMPQGMFSADNMTYPGESATVEYAWYNIKAITFKLFRNPDIYNNDVDTDDLTPLYTYTQPLDKAYGSDKMEISIPEAGYYTLKVSVEDESKAQANEETFNIMATPILGVMSSGTEKDAAIAVDYKTGAPVKDVAIYDRITLNREETSRQLLGKTNKKGYLYFTVPGVERFASHSLVYKYKGEDYFFENLNPSTFREQKQQLTSYSSKIFTDRQLYHPGDTINWAVVIGVKEQKHASRTCAATPVTVILKNANYQGVDTINVVTDAYGRAHGQFVTTKGVLTGNWQIWASIDDKKSTSFRYVTVSDFRLPTFYAEVSSIERDVPATGQVRISGKASTFSGMPVAGARVQAEIEKIEFWGRWAGGSDSESVSGLTSSDGSFSLDIPKQLFEDLSESDDDHNASSFYQAVITVTAADASTAQCRKNFNIGKPYALSVPIQDTYDTSKPLSFKINAMDANGDNAPIGITWELFADGGTSSLMNGQAIAGTPFTIEPGMLGAGDYHLTVKPLDPSLANEDTSATFTFYNTQKGFVPDDGEPIFVPVDKATVEKGKIKIPIGVHSGTSYVYAFMANGKELTVDGPKKIGEGFTTVSFEVTEGISEITLVSGCNGSFCTARVGLVWPMPKPDKIIAESFRDNIVPGAGEKWKFRFVDSKGKGISDAAAIMTMYNKALDELETYSMGLSFYFPTPYYWLTLITTDVAYKPAIMSFRDKTPRPAFVQLIPEFRYSNIQQKYTLTANGMSGAVPGIMARKAAAGATKDAGVDYEETLTLSEETLTLNAADISADIYDEEDVENEDAVPAESEGSSDADVNPDASFNYRSGEALQALWLPQLTADANGDFEITFTVPNANGTWNLRSVAWTKDLRTADFMAQCMANKPVMVQPNLPRFLRQGDTATILSTVFNNTGEATVAHCFVEVFNIETKAVTDTVRRSVPVAPNGSAIVPIDVTAPYDVNAIGYRIKVDNGVYADGEQDIIPVLSSSCTVIESTEFYLNPDRTEPFDLSVNTTKETALTLQYCQNPVWTVVKAMRGITNESSSISSAMASKLFSALAARHIVTENPAISEAIRQWRDNPDSKALTSMLEKNETLKALMLDETPWVSTATDNSARMAALAELLDSATVQARISALAKDLKKQQAPSGGFAWGTWNRDPSLWTTRSVMMTLGIANSMGLISETDSDILSLFQPAFGYLCTEASRVGSPATDTYLALIDAFFPALKATDKAAKIVTASVDAAAKNWKGTSVNTKAWSVIMLHAFGRDTEAKSIFESIRQFGKTSPDRGTSFPSVNDIRTYASVIQAYKAMGASDAEINALRQWVIIRAQAMDNLGASNPDYVISSLLMSGSNWTDVPVENKVSVNGKAISIPEQEAATGYFATNIPVKGSRVDISISPNGTTPSYGSVISISRAPMSTVAAKPSADIEINKRVLVQRNGEWVETDSLALGERVRVQLTIVTRRDLQYITIDDERPATFEPVEQLPGNMFQSGLYFYRENLNAATRLFITNMAKGTYILSYDMTANVAGRFISGIATLQSQYAPELTAHSGAASFFVK